MHSFGAGQVLVEIIRGLETRDRAEFFQEEVVATCIDLHCECLLGLFHQ